ncbi:COBW domain-containing protein [Lachnellula occidentalis]|uniref:COBW domain-containing protein n=1 Tax=Lachnellula occidentalis TaxID=215460 RepID=A0A8H8S4N6_9HELO|nr:COBW domain-containing protein [Lachnellula occidentalis]
MDFEDDEAPPLLVDVESQENADEEADRIRVPITIITGYLGAGKTTLMNYILNEQHGKKIAVILNGMDLNSRPIAHNILSILAADIEKTLTVNTGGEQVQEWLEVGNGCICCSVKDQGVNAIESLMEKKGAFDYILLETTGLADPGNLAPLFWVDEGLGSSIYLDGIVTLIDAKNVLRNLDEPAQDTIPSEEHEHEHDGHAGPLLTTAHLQISHADVIVINKSDLVSEEELEAVQARVQAINGLAKLHITQHGQVPQLEGFLLDLHAYDNVGSLDVGSRGHSHLDPSISTVTISVPVLTPDQLPHLDAWLRAILWDSKLPAPNNGSEDEDNDNYSRLEIHRVKAKLPLSTGDIKIVQGVRDVFEILDARENPSAEPSLTGKIVLIGRFLLNKPFKESFISTVGQT